MSNTLQRILTALIAVPLVLGLAYLGGWPFGLLVIGIALVAQHETYALLKEAGMQPYVGPGLVLGALVGLRFFWPWTVPLAVVAVPLLMSGALLADDQPRPLQRLAATLTGVIYPALFLSYLVPLRLGGYRGLGDLDAFWITLAVFVLIWTTDTFAYVVGRAIGTHPLAPRISPKKTWEGAIGGFTGAVVGAVVLKLTLLAFLGWTDIFVLAVVCGAFSQLGDLAESRLKRSVGVKDSGTVLPGHGGLLDRFDAMIFAAPLVYVYLAYVPAF